MPHKPSLDNRDIRVPIHLTVDEFLYLESQAEAAGLGKSAYFRKLLNDTKRTPETELSAFNDLINSAEGAQEMSGCLKKLAALIQGYK